MSVAGGVRPRHSLQEELNTSFRLSLLVGTRLKRFLHTLSLFLVLATYLWGGCVSCKQFFMLPGAADDCCQHGKCKRTSPESSSQRSRSEQVQRECLTMPFAHHPQDDGAIAIVFVDLPADAIPAAELLTSDCRHSQQRVYFDPVADSPPDLVVQTASFLI